MSKQTQPDSVTISVTRNGARKAVTLNQRRDPNGEFYPPVDELLSKAMGDALEWVRRPAPR